MTDSIHSSPSLADLLEDASFLIQRKGENEHLCYHRILNTIFDHLGAEIYNRLFFAIGASKIEEWSKIYPRNKTAHRAFSVCATHIATPGGQMSLQPSANMYANRLSRMGTSSTLGHVRCSVMMANAINSCFETRFTTRGIVALIQHDDETTLDTVRTILEEIATGVDHTMPFLASEV